MTPDRLHQLFEYRDGNLFWKVDRFPRKTAGQKAGSVAKHGYVHVCIDRKVYLAHRLIWLMQTGKQPDHIDHINGNRSDNRFENLRSCSQADNNKNQGLMCSNTSGSKGVSWYSPYKKWRVCVRSNGKQKNLGYFEDFELAELVAIEGREKFHGNFARHQ